MLTPTTSAPARRPGPARLCMPDGRQVTLREMRESDALAERQFLAGLSPETRRARFLCTVREIDDDLLALLLTPGAGVRAIVAVTPGGPGEPVDRMVGVGRYARIADTPVAECAITVADDCQRMGLGTALFQALCAAARDEGLARLRSIDAASNSRMREFARGLGAHARTDPDDATQVVYDFEL